MLWRVCVYVSNIKTIRLTGASLGIFMDFCANLPLVAPIFKYQQILLINTYFCI